MKATRIPKIRSHKHCQQKSHDTPTHLPTQTPVSLCAASVSFHYPDCLYIILVTVTFCTFTHQFIPYITEKPMHHYYSDKLFNVEENLSF